MKEGAWGSWSQHPHNYKQIPEFLFSYIGTGVVMLQQRRWVVVRCGATCLSERSAWKTFVTCFCYFQAARNIAVKNALSNADLSSTKKPRLPGWCRLHSCLVSFANYWRPKRERVSIFNQPANSSFFQSAGNLNVVSSACGMNPLACALSQGYSESLWCGWCWRCCGHAISTRGRFWPVP